MKITLDVKFDSGAKVILTKEETQKVAEFITRMLFETHKVEKQIIKRRSRKGEKPLKWTTEDLLKIKQILLLPKTEQRKAYKELAPQINRTYGGVTNQAYRIEKGFTKLPEPVYQNFAERLMTHS